MPIYEYRCDPCDHVTDAYRPVSDLENCPACEKCNGPTRKIISSYRVIGDFQPYYDDNLESHIKSKQHRKQVMKDKGVTEVYGKGWT